MQVSQWPHTPQMPRGIDQRLDSERPAPATGRSLQPSMLANRPQPMSASIIKSGVRAATNLSRIGDLYCGQIAALAMSEPASNIFSASHRSTMSKSQKSNKEMKKQPLLTPKEQKAAKQAKKHARDVAPLIVKGG